MTKRLLAIYLVLVVLIALLVPSCAGAQCTIYVQATLCGTPWQGAVNYTLTAAGGAPISGTSVQSTHTVDCGTWTCAYVAGGPVGAFLNSITPNPTQTVSGGGNITFTLDFELNQDAAIQWLMWTIDGVIWQSPTLETVPCHIIDAHFKQWVNGCPGYNVTMDEMSWLSITQTAGPAAMVVVVNDDCAVNKTPPPQGLSPVKKSQVTTVNNVTRQKGYNITLLPQEPTMLDVHTQWQLVKCVNYTKAINWFGISLAPIVEPHPCVLFELILPHAGGAGDLYQFTLQAAAEVALVGDTDVNPANNKTTSPWPLLLTVDLRP